MNRSDSNILAQQVGTRTLTKCYAKAYVAAVLTVAAQASYARLVSMLSSNYNLAFVFWSVI